MFLFLTLTKSSKSMQSRFMGTVTKLKLIHTPKAMKIPLRSAAVSYTATCVMIKTTTQAKINPRKSWTKDPAAAFDWQTAKHYFSVLQNFNSENWQFPLTYKSSLRISSLALFIKGMRLTCSYLRFSSRTNSGICSVGFFTLKKN